MFTVPQVTHARYPAGANDGTIIAMYDQRKQGNHAQYKKTMV